MNTGLLLLMVEAMGAYLLVLGAHALRRRAGMPPFYALLGGMTAVMSWVTDAGVEVRVAGITFMPGSTVFYTALLLGVFVVYVFDGPHATRVVIGTVAGVSVLVPLVAVVLHLQMRLAGHPPLGYVPVPSLRVNAASVVTTVADLVFLAVAWEFLGRPRLRVPLWLRTVLTLLGVMAFDVVLFTTGAFAGAPAYPGILAGSLLSRLAVTLFASPLLYAYLAWQSGRPGVSIENRPVLAILREVARVRSELGLAQQEIRRRMAVEREKEELIRKLEASIARVYRLEGLLPACSGCRRIRLDPADAEGPQRWVSLEDYLRRETTVQFSHGMCPDCIRRDYPEMADQVRAASEERRRVRTPPPPGGCA